MSVASPRQLILAAIIAGLLLAVSPAAGRPSPPSPPRPMPTAWDGATVEATGSFCDLRGCQPVYGKFDLYVIKQGKRGKRRSLRDFRFSLPGVCGDGYSGGAGFDPPLPIKIGKRRTTVSFETDATQGFGSPTAQATITGEFTDKTRSKGTVRVVSEDGSCDTGELLWKIRAYGWSPEGGPGGGE